MKKLFSSVVLAVFAVFVFPQFASALTVSPARIEVSGDPGAFVNGEITLFNNDIESKTYFVSSENFEPRGDSGAPYFIGANGGLATWISVNTTEVIVPPQSEISVPYTIRIPASTTPGGYFAAIFFGTQPPQGSSMGGDVAVGGKIGVLILLRVNGDIEESGGLVSFETLNNKKFFNQIPVGMQYRFNNTGGDRVVPRGSIFVKNIFGGTVEELKANMNEGSVLPGSMRRFETVWGDIEGVAQVDGEESSVSMSFFQHVAFQWRNFHIGRFKMELSIVWGQSGTQSASESLFIYVIPWQLLVVILGGLCIVLMIFRYILKKYTQMVLRHAGVYNSAPVEKVPTSNRSDFSAAQHKNVVSREEKITQRQYTPVKKQSLQKKHVTMQQGGHTPKKMDAIKPKRKI